MQDLYNLCRHSTYEITLTYLCFMGDINVKMQHNYIAFLCTMLHVNIMLHVGVKNADSEGGGWDVRNHN